MIGNIDRKLKFRAWPNKEKRMISWEEILKDYTRVNILYEWAHPLHDIVLMQYTNLKDINGKEIFEGDIFKTKSWDDYDILYVYFDKNKAAFMATSVNGLRKDFLINYDGDIELIGNICENEELMNNGINTTMSP